MKTFYSRKDDLDMLEKQFQLTSERCTMTVLTGRRRIGKTFLATEFAKRHDHIYFFTARKDEALLVQDFMQQIRDTFQYPFPGTVTTFKEIFKLLMELGKTRRYVLIIDEFQEFYTINPSVFSEIQNLYDTYKYKANVQVIFIGSLYSLMQKIFTDSKEPLFGRADIIHEVKPFTCDAVEEILQDQGHLDARTLFNWYLVTGNVPRYIGLLSDYKAYAMKDILALVFNSNSPFLDEGKIILIEEFGKEYGTYFSILSLLANGKTSRNEIETSLGKNVGGYLEKLEDRYGIIRRHRPINAKPNGKLMKYEIVDNFLLFWFRFVYGNQSAIELENFNGIITAVSNQLPAYSGIILERLIQQELKERHIYSAIGNYWEKGNQNEVDIVAVNEQQRQILIGEVKINKKKGSLAKLEGKTTRLLADYPKYEVEYRLFGLEDILTRS